MPEIEKQVKSVVKLDNRVHAEIQLVYHYAQNPQGIFQPRVLCSSKEACYLCNLFIQTHGKFHTPRSHGNFYREWRLPRFDEF
jgi:hypothetical protein